VCETPKHRAAPSLRRSDTAPNTLLPQQEHTPAKHILQPGTQTILGHLDHLKRRQAESTRLRNERCAAHMGPAPALDYEQNVRHRAVASTLEDAALCAGACAQPGSSGSSQTPASAAAAPSPAAATAYGGGAFELWRDAIYAAQAQRRLSRHVRTYLTGARHGARASRDGLVAGADDDSKRHGEPFVTPNPELQRPTPKQRPSQRPQSGDALRGRSGADLMSEAISMQSACNQGRSGADLMSEAISMQSACNQGRSGAASRSSHAELSAAEERRKWTRPRCPDGL
jgi:hypothetical protein